MTLKRQSIAVVGAIVGANLIGIVTYPQAANSNGLCDGFSRLWQGSDYRPVNQSHEPRTDIPYWQNNPWAETAAKPAPASTHTAPSAPTRTQSRPPTAGAPAPISGSSLLGTESQESYQLRRRAIAVQMEDR